MTEVWLGLPLLGLLLATPLFVLQKLLWILFSNYCIICYHIIYVIINIGEKLRR